MNQETSYRKKKKKKGKRKGKKKERKRKKEEKRKRHVFYDKIASYEVTRGCWGGAHRFFFVKKDFFSPMG
jgi:hypothetical protein